MIYSDLDRRVRNKEIETFYIGIVYVHGKMMDILNYDLLVTDDKNLSDLIMNPQKEKEILFLDVKDNENNIYKAKAFLWKKKNQNRYTGLICLLDDTESILDAENKYNRMEQNI